MQILVSDIFRLAGRTRVAHGGAGSRMLQAVVLP